MRQAMAAAEVGDDVYSDDPTVRHLEETAAALLGKEAALFVPSGTMCNQIALRAHTELGDTVLLDDLAHIYRIEGASTASISGVVPRLLPAIRGVFTADSVVSALPLDHPFFPKSVQSPVKLLCVENTHNFAGGAVWPVAALNSVAAAAVKNGINTHMDGARLWHASVATGVPESTLAARFNTVSVCFSKALGAPVGSCLAGPVSLIRRARRIRQILGGGMRQSGILAAGALHALEHHRPRLHETHSFARRFTEGIAHLPGIELDPATVETNIVIIGLKGISSVAFVEEAHRRGLFVLPFGQNAVRAVLYLDITNADVERAIAIVGETTEALSAQVQRQ